MLHEWLGWVLAGAILAAMAIFGWKQRRREKETDSWVNDPRKSAFENWMEKRRQRFSPARGLRFFVLGLVAFTVVIGVNVLFGDAGSIGGAVAFVLIMSAAAGLIGIFTEDVPL